MNETTATSTRSLYWGITSRGQKIIGLGRLLDEYEAARWDHDEDDHQHSMEAVQAEEACWIATHGWIWQGLLDAKTLADLDDLAWSCDEQARARQDDGHGWAADVWEAVAAYIRQIMPVEP